MSKLAGNSQSISDERRNGNLAKQKPMKAADRIMYTLNVLEKS
jgi:hypothetical protein